MTDGDSSRSGDAGFTLLELLVALALMAVIGTTMAVAVTQLRPMRAVQQHIEQREVAAVMVDVMVRDIKAAARLPLIDGGSSTSKLLIGAPQKLTFSAVVPTGFQRRALREVTYEVVNSGGGTRLVRTIRMRRFSQDTEALRPQTDELWSGDFKIQLRYLVGGDETWQDSFDKTNSLPRALSISFTFANASQRTISRVVTLFDTPEN